MGFWKALGTILSSKDGLSKFSIVSKNTMQRNQVSHFHKKAILGYWDIRGVAQPIRLLLEYTGQEWEDKLYECGLAPDFEKKIWLGEKENLGLDFPNLPYYMDNEIKLTQSSAILRYIARMYKLDGQIEKEKQRIDLIEGVVGDLKGPFSDLCYAPNFETMKKEYLLALPLKLQRLSNFLGERPYFAGDNITFVDFMAYETLEQHKYLDIKMLKDFKNLTEFQDRIQNLDQIADYMNSPRFIKYPLNNKMANFGG